MPKRLAQQYELLKRLARDEVGHVRVANLIREMSTHARQLLQNCERVALRSSVADKSYFGFRGSADSRPINDALYVRDERRFETLLEGFEAGWPNSGAEDVNMITYTIALSVFAAHDTGEVGRKSSATFFEILIGHIVARILGTSPRKKVRMPESNAKLPTDYVFDPGVNQRKLHLPIKTSTRERAVQAWVHQLMLDRIFGNGIYRGVLVVSGETKRNATTGVVTEICVPRQLQMFQSRVAELSRIYYLDPPQVYLNLSRNLARLDVRPFGEIVVGLGELMRD